MKRGQFDISFGMIFSIIIILAIIGVAGYVIIHFMGLNACAQSGLFYKDLQERVNKAYQADRSKEVFTPGVPSGVSEVCFGDLNIAPGAKYIKEYKAISLVRTDRNMFFYPPYKSCDSTLAGFRIEHLNASSLFCVPVISGKVQLNINKENYEALVRIDK